MPDVLTPKQRKYCMSRIRGTNTRPELLVRRLVHALGYRYRLHVRTLPGCPDLVLPRHKKVIFVHGCFWHRHRCKYGRPQPQTNAAFWERKLLGNVQRDKRNLLALRRAGWRILTIWECQTRNSQQILDRLTKFLTLTRIRRRE